MKILVGDTCLKTASAIISNGKNILSYMQSMGEEPHSVMFPKLVEQVLSTSRIGFKALDAIACVYGPGSFTGVRIGLTYLKTIAYTLDLPFYVLNTLDVLANMEAGKRHVISVPLIEARNNEVFTAMYESEKGIYKRITPYMAKHIDKVIEQAVSICAKDENALILLSGDAQVKYISRFQDSLPDRILPYSEERDYVDLKRACFLISENCRENPFTAEPFYLRESGAVRMKKQQQ